MVCSPRHGHRALARSKGGTDRRAIVPAPGASRPATAGPVPPGSGDNRPSMRVGLTALHLRARLPPPSTLLLPPTSVLLNKVFQRIQFFLFSTARGPFGLRSLVVAPGCRQSGSLRSPDALARRNSPLDPPSGSRFMVETSYCCRPHITSHLVKQSFTFDISFCYNDSIWCIPHPTHSPCCPACSRRYRFLGELTFPGLHAMKI